MERRETRSPLAERLSFAPDGDETAAVALILAGPSEEVGLIRRAEHPSDPWSGHMALPGGRRENTDRTLLETAIRETCEEIGLSLREDDYRGRLPALRTYGRGMRGHVAVAPLVFSLDARPESTLSDEVAEILWIPRVHLVDPKIRSVHRLEVPEGVREFPALSIEGRVVWGLTHRILEDFLGPFSTGRDG